MPRSLFPSLVSLLLLLGDPTVLLGDPTAAAPGATSAALADAAVGALAAALVEAGPVTQNEIVTHVARGAGMAPQAARAGLIGLLDSLTARAPHREPPWPLARSETVRTERAVRLFDELVAWSRRSLADSADYALDVVLERASAAAKVPTHAARDLLVTTLEAQWHGTARLLPRRLSLQVQGSSRYQVDSTRFALLMRSEDDVLRQTRFRDVHVPIVSAVVPLLAAAPEVRWAVETPPVNLQPDATLRIEITDFHGLRRLRGSRGPLVTARVYLALEAPGQPLYSDIFDVVYDFSLEEDPEVRGQRRLDGFVAHVAGTVRDAVTAYLRRR